MQVSPASTAPLAGAAYRSIHPANQTPGSPRGCELPPPYRTVSARGIYNSPVWAQQAAGFRSHRWGSHKVAPFRRFSRSQGTGIMQGPVFGSLLPAPHSHLASHGSRP